MFDFFQLNPRDFYFIPQSLANLLLVKPFFLSVFCFLSVLTWLFSLLSSKQKIKTPNHEEGKSVVSSYLGLLKKTG